MYYTIIAWGPSDPNFKLTDDTSDRGEYQSCFYNIYKYYANILLRIKIYIVPLFGCRSHDTATKERRRAHKKTDERVHGLGQRREAKNFESLSRHA